MAKITSLTEDSGIGIYYEKAMQKYDDGDYVGCLDLLFTARELLNEPYCEDDLTLLLEIADTYAEMGLFEESNKYYFILTQYNYSLDEVFYSLIKNFILTGNLELAVYYLNFGMEVGLLNSDDGFSAEELEDLVKPPQEKLRLMKDNDSEYLVQVARQLVNSHDTEFAKQMLSSVPPHSKHYADAENFLAVIEIGSGNAEKGIEHCDAVLERKPDDISALTAKLVARKIQGNEQEVAELKNTITELDISDLSDIGKVAMCMAEIGDSALTAKYCDRILGENPYERNIMLVGALAHANIGNRARAKDLIVSLCTVYGYDYTAKYYARLIDAHDGEAALPLTFIMDNAEKTRRNEMIEKALGKAVNPIDFVRAYEDDEELYEYVMWSLYEECDATAVKVGKTISRTRNGFALARKLLLYPDCSVVLKKAVFLQLFKTGSVFRLSMINNDRLFMFHPILPKVTRRSELVDAYWQVYSALAFIETGYDKKLNEWYKKAVAAFDKEKEKLKPAAIAALIAYKSQINKIFALDTYCCEVFDCEYRDFVLYSKKLDEVLRESKPVRKRATAGRAVRNE